MVTWEWLALDHPWTIIIGFLVILFSYPLVLGVRRVSRRAGDTPPVGLLDVYVADQSCLTADEVQIEIIAVHGLGADSERTWTARGEKPKKNATSESQDATRRPKRIAWLKEFLPESFPGSHIMIFGYHANWLLKTPLKSTRQSAKYLLDCIKAQRADSKAHRPIIFIAHSFGGIVVKEALVLAKNRTEYANIFEATVGVLFLGTPHKGSSISWLGAHAASLLGPILGSNDLLIKSLGYHSIELAEKQEDFLACYDDKSIIYNFYETVPTWLVGLPLGMIVDRTSATIDGLENIDLDLDHSELNKFKTKDSLDYKKVLSILQKIVGSAQTSLYVKGIKNKASIETAFQQCQINRQLARNSLRNLANFYKTSSSMINTSPQAKWFLESKDYHEWLSHSKESTCNEAFLWYTGRPDAAKTEAMTHVVENLLNASESTPTLAVLYYFGRKPKEANTRALHSQTTAIDILRSIICQLVCYDKSNISALTEENQLHLYNLVDRDLEIADGQQWGLLRRLLTVHSKRRILILIDSLEAIHPESERLQFVHQLRNLWDFLVLESSTKVKMLVASLPYDPIRQAFNLLPSIDPIREVLACLDSLKSLAPNYRQKDDRIKHAYSGTGNWIISDPEYKTWDTDNRSGIIWLMGRAGSGKSTLLWKLLELKQQVCKIPSLQDLLDDPQNFRRFTQRIVPDVGSGDIDTEEPMDSTPKPRKTIVASFFYSQELKSDTSHTRMLGSLLFQILCQEVRLIELYQTAFLRVQENCATVAGLTEGSAQNVGWEFEDLKAVFLNLKNFTDIPLTIFIFLDGVDESEASEMRSEVLQLITCDDSKVVSGPVMKTMIASRRLGQTPRMTISHCEFSLDDRNSADIVRFVEARMDQIREHISKFDLETRKEYDVESFRTNLVNNAKGVFLWVSLILQMVTTSFKDGLSSPEEMKAILKTPPDRLEDLYRKIIVRLSGFREEMIKKGKLWLTLVAFADHFWDVKEFADAVAVASLIDTPVITNAKLTGTRISINEQDNFDSFRHTLTNVCGGFLELHVSQQLSTTNPRLKVEVQNLSQAKTSIQLLHWTVKVFLQKNEAEPFRTSFRPAVKQIARTCIRYLELSFSPENIPNDIKPRERLKGVLEWKMAQFESFAHYLERRPFLHYSFLCLPSHLAEMEVEGDELTDAVVKIFQTLGADTKMPARFILSSWMNHAYHSHDGTTSSMVGSQPLKLWKTHLERNIHDDDDRTSAHFLATALTTAVKLKLFRAVKILCAAGASGELVDNQHFLSAVQMASKSRSTEIFEFLVQQRATAKGQEAIDTTGPETTPVPTQRHMSSYRRTSITPKHHDIGDAFLHAVKEGNIKTVEVLLKVGVSPDMKSNLQESAIQLAASKGHRAIVDLLVDVGADPDSIDDSGLTPLAVAARNGHEAVAQRLLQAGADINSRDKNSRTPLDHAIERGHEAVIRQLLEYGATSEDLRLQATQFMVPFERNEFFHGRENEIQRLHLLFNSTNKEQQRVALIGLGGIGKTEIAVEFAYKIKERNPEVSVFWVTMSSARSIEMGYEDIAKRLQLPGWNSTNSNAWGQVKGYLENPLSGRWLLILDNADEGYEYPQTRRNFPTLLSSYIPSNSNGFVLLTCRNRGLASRTCRAVIHVQPLHVEAAKAILRNKVHGVQDDQNVELLAQALDYLPLAISQAAEFINVNGITVEQYLKLFNDSTENQHELLGTEFEDLRRDVQSSNAISNTWQLSFQHIEQENPEAAKLLSLMSVLDNGHIPGDILRPNEMSNLEFYRAIGTLKAFSLVESGENQDEYKMHKLVQLSTMAWLESANSLRTWTDVALGKLAAKFPSGNFENWSTCAALLPHAQAVLSRLSKDHESTPDFLILSKNVGDYLNAAGRYRDALAHFEAVKSRLELSFSPEDREMIGFRSLIATTYRLAGRLKDAEWLGESVVRETQLVFGKEHPTTLTSMYNLGGVLMDEERWAEADHITQQVLKLRSHELGEYHPDTLVCSVRLGLSIHDQIDGGPSTEVALQRLLQIRRQSVGDMHPDTLSVMRDLARFRTAQHQYAEAESIMMDVFKSSENILGGDHPLTLEFANNLAQVFCNSGRIGDTRMLAEKTSLNATRILGQMHPITLKSLEILAESLLHLREFAASMRQYQHVNDMYTKLLGADYPVTKRLGWMYLEVEKKLRIETASAEGV